MHLAGGTLVGIHENGLGVIGGLIFTAISLRSETKMRHITNLLKITESHQQLWLCFHQCSDLTPVLAAMPDLKHQPFKLIETES